MLSPVAIACELQARSTHAHDTTGHIVGASKISTSAFTASMEIVASAGDRGKWSIFSYVRILKGSFSIRSDTLAPATLSRGRFLSDRTRICETILMTPRAAADRPRALGYMVWMRTIDT